MTVDLLANRKRLNKFFGLFVLRLKCDLCQLEADVTSCVTGVPGTIFYVQKHCFCPK